MARHNKQRAVDRAHFRSYRAVADHFADAADASIDLEYWTAAGVLIVHAAIAYADALCIKISGKRSVGSDHDDAVDLLDLVVAGGQEKGRALSELRRIIEEKTRISYLGELYGPGVVRAMRRRLSRFRGWAQPILDR